MARALSALESDSSGWYLNHPTERLHRIRKNGFYAGWASLEELRDQCQRLSGLSRSDAFVDSTSEAGKLLSDPGMGPEVENFFVFDEEDSLVSFADLPFAGETRKIDTKWYLRGKADGGCREVMLEVREWELKYGKSPVLFVRDCEGRWIQLGKLGVGYAADVARSGVVLVNFLNFVKRNLDAPPKAIWDHLHEVCSRADTEPSEADLLKHIDVLKRAAEQDSDLGGSSVIQSLLKKRKADDDFRTAKRLRRYVEEEEDDDDTELGESVCAICDDGGALVCCDGPCMRSFHAVQTDFCESLNLPPSQVKGTEKFYCKNCSENKHQCFQCGKLGHSFEEVFPCSSVFCGKFYHLSCISELLDDQATESSFTCPLHRCFKCHLGEKQEEGLWLYPCRRCPRAWHQHCTDPGVGFPNEGGCEQRVWIVGKTRFLYCMRHELDPVFCTPERGHIKFPAPAPTETSETQPSVVLSNEHCDSTPTPCPSRLEKSSQRAGTSVEQRLFSKAEIVDPVRSIICESKVRVTVEEITEKLKMPSTVASAPNKIVAQQNKIRSLLRAFQRAFELLQNGGSLEEARTMITLQQLNLLDSCREGLKVYLSPMLYGMRYSSFGRHFTRLDKLEQVVNKLCWYVDTGDMVADFCCGANLFSQLLAKRLTEMSKRCYFKNYDIMQPSDTFNFERKDYMAIKREDLCHGNNLIVGLNPPFGVKGQTASRFAEHAASFRPKLIILIAPQETRSLEMYGYRLVWEDKELLRGEAFYLPGSVDARGKAIYQENNVAPVLFLWSRADWVDVHRRIAAGCGHLRFDSVHGFCSTNSDGGEPLECDEMNGTDQTCQPCDSQATVVGTSSLEVQTDKQQLSNACAMDHASNAAATTESGQGVHDSGNLHGIASISIKSTNRGALIPHRDEKPTVSSRESREEAGPTKGTSSAKAPPEREAQEERVAGLGSGVLVQRETVTEDRAYKSPDCDGKGMKLKCLDGKEQPSKRKRRRKVHFQDEHRSDTRRTVTWEYGETGEGMKTENLDYIPGQPLIVNVYNYMVPPGQAGILPPPRIQGPFPGHGILPRPPPIWPPAPHPRGAPPPWFWQRAPPPPPFWRPPFNGGFPER